jgi:hypothetical protein
LISRQARALTRRRAQAARRKALTLGAMLISMTLVACGESSQDKAKKDVCGARTEISKQITKLQGLTPTSNAVNEAKSSLEVIGTELRKIKDAQHNLAPARKEQVEPATKAFESELKVIASSVAASISSGGVESALKGAAPQLKTALSKLANSYKQTLGPINCS